MNTENPFGNSFLSPGSLGGLGGSSGDNLFSSGGNFLNIELDIPVSKMLEEEKMKNAALTRELAQEKRLRKEAERELAHMKKFMFTDMSSVFGGKAGGDAMLLNSTLSADVPSFAPGPSSAHSSPSKSIPMGTFGEDSLRQNMVSESLEILEYSDLLACGGDILKDIDVLSTKMFATPDKTDSKRRESRHNFGNMDADEANSVLSPRTIDSGDVPQSEGLEPVLSTAGQAVLADSARKRADVAPLNIEQLELWLKCKTDFSSKWMQQKSDFLDKWNFCQEQFMSRWMKEVSSRFSTEDFYEYPIKCFIYHILSTRGPQPCGEIGKILKEITQNNEIHLMQMIKVNYKGLKKFIELFSDLFHIGTEHPFNPTVYLVQRRGPPPFPPHLVSDLVYANEILQLGLKVNNIENEHIEKHSTDDAANSSGYNGSPNPYYENSGYYHRTNHSISTDSAVSSRTNSAASHRDTSIETVGRSVAHEMRAEHMFYDPGSDTWNGIGQTSHYGGGPNSMYDKNNQHGNKQFHQRHMKRPSRSNIFSVAVDPPPPPPAKSGHRKK